MAKTKSTKSSNKSEKAEKSAPITKGEFRVFTKINGVVTDVTTDDIASAIMAAKPALPKTTLTIRVTKGDVVRDRFLLLKDARRLYSNSTTLDMFIKNLLF